VRIGVWSIAYNKLIFTPSRLWLARFVLGLALLGLSGITGHVRGGEAIEQIRFAHGASSAEVTGGVIRGERALYMFGARAGQTASLRISAPENNAVFQIYAPGAEPEIRDSIMEIRGEALPGAAEGDDAVQWEGILPSSGSYLLVIGPTRGNAEYRLNITIR
jgi:hypothetical protein